METFTFENEGFKFTVKSDFLKTVPNLIGENGKCTMTTYELASKHELGTFFHCATGPAVFEISTGHGEYWLNGKFCDEEVANKIKHGADFHDKIMKDLAD